jgi:hypothetical protein
VDRRARQFRRCVLALAGFIALVAASSARAQSGDVVVGGATCDTDSSPIVCALDTSTTSVDISALVSALAGENVTTQTPIWVQAWGGNGGRGAGDTVHASGGAGGFTQTILTAADLSSSYQTTTLYYYLGDEGATTDSSSDEVAAGGGGATTVFSTANLATTAPTTSNVIALASGGGGGAGEQEAPNSLGDAGGLGGTAVASTAGPASGPGSAGTNSSGTPSSHSGSGGTCPGGGAKGKGPDGNGQYGGSGFGGVGGAGGRNGNHSSAAYWSNGDPTQLTNGGGGGWGHNGEEFPNSIAGGGGGGAGYGGGGGGAVGVGSFDPGAGGGGCGWAAQALASDSLAPSGFQPNPSSDPDGGAAQLVFDNTSADQATFTVPTPASPGGSGSITAHYKVSVESGTKTFYPESGSLTGLWDQSSQSLSQGTGNLAVESGGGTELPEQVAISGATITAATSACSPAPYQLDGTVAVTGVPVIGLVTGQATLCGTGDITGQTSYTGSLSDINTSDIKSVEINGLLLQMTPDLTVASPKAQRVKRKLRVKVGCLDQDCRFRIGGTVRLPRKGRSAAKVSLKKSYVSFAKGKAHQLDVRMKRASHTGPRVRRLIRTSKQARRKAHVKFRVKAHGSHGAVGHKGSKSKLRS